jgi:Rps23 Pro-64 3,4-dihydroxylase Tpa1-like proline 4-hydroxylase
MQQEITVRKESLEELHANFMNANPFPHVYIDDFLETGLANSLSENFPPLSEMDILYHGLNENKGEHSNFQNLHEDFRRLQHLLSSETFIGEVESISGISDFSVINDRYGCGLHQGGNGSFLDIHIDYNLHPFEKKQRRLNLIIFLNENWQKDWGGYLEFWNAASTECVTSIEPKFNRCVLFICNNISYHGYNRIKCPASVTRKSFYLYFFSHPEKKLFFHDTVFTTPPNDNIYHKYRVKVKELLKNNVKRFLYYSGLNKFLK